MRLILLISLIFSSGFCNENENFYVTASEQFNLDPWILWSIGDTESKHNPYAINKNSNGTYDVGVMQINSCHFGELKRKYGLEPKDLYDPKVSIYVGASILKDCFNTYGNNLKAINCYNGLNYDNRINNTYAKRVYQHYLDGKKRYADK